MDLVRNEGHQRILVEMSCNNAAEVVQDVDVQPKEEILMTSGFISGIALLQLTRTREAKAHESNMHSLQGEPEHHSCRNFSIL